MSYTCPKCKQSSHTSSLAALNYKETSLSDTQGRFSGSAIGTGGIMLGGGSYSGHTTTRTKRAAKFDEPEEVESNSLSFLFLGLCGFIGFTVIAGSFMNSDAPLSMFSLFGVPSSSSISPSSNIAPFQKGILDIKEHYATFLGAFFVFTAALILFLYWKRALQSEDKAAEYNKQVLPKFQERYAQLHYCEKCHVIFDEKGKYESATENGFDNMMAIPQ